MSFFFAGENEMKNKNKEEIFCMIPRNVKVVKYIFLPGREKVPTAEEWQ